MSAAPPVPANGRRALAGLALATVTVAGALTAVTAAPASAACTDVDVVFARGTGEAQGLGSVGGPFASAVVRDLPGRSVSTYAVVYAANVTQTSAAPGSTDMANHVASVAAACPGTEFVIGGYSQGGTVTDKAVGIRTGFPGGTTIPAAYAPRVSAVIVFGNPLGLTRQTIASASPTYGPRSRDYCNTGDPVCGNGFNIIAHLTYAINGSTDAGARVAADLVNAS